MGLAVEVEVGEVDERRWSGWVPVEVEGCSLKLDHSKKSSKIAKIAEKVKKINQNVCKSEIVEKDV